MKLGKDYHRHVKARIEAYKDRY